MTERDCKIIEATLNEFLAEDACRVAPTADGIRLELNGETANYSLREITQLIIGDILASSKSEGK